MANDQFYPPNQDFKRAVESVLDEKLDDRIYDIVWKKTFHYITFFETLDNFGKSGTVTADQTEVTLTTGAVSGNSASIFLAPLHQGLITFSQPSRFRTYIRLNAVTSQTAYIMIGDNTGSNIAYGFKIVNATLSGFVYNGTSETLVTLVTLVSGTSYILEARYLPGQRIMFLVDDPVNSILIREVGSISTGLMTTARTANQNLFLVNITTNTAAARVMRLSFFEYYQRRDILR